MLPGVECHEFKLTTGNTTDTEEAWLTLRSSEGSQFGSLSPSRVSGCLICAVLGSVQGDSSTDSEQIRRNMRNLLGPCGFRTAEEFEPHTAISLCPNLLMR